MEVIPISNVEYTSQEDWSSYESHPFSDDGDVSSKAIDGLTARLEEELKQAKRTHFSSGEVLLPYGLLQAIAAQVLRLAEIEPCGLRGCTMYIRFRRGGGAQNENGSNNNNTSATAATNSGESVTTLRTLKFDPYTASTFEVYLTLKQSAAGWNSFLPQFLKKITRGGTVMIDSDYKLEKNKLYRSCDE